MLSVILDIFNRGSSVFVRFSLSPGGREPALSLSKGLG